MFEKLKGYRVEEQKVYFQYEGAGEEKEPCVEVISDSIINVFVDYTGLGHRSRAIEWEQTREGDTKESIKSVKPESVSQNESGVTIKTKKVTVVVGDNFQVDFYDCKGMPLSLAHRGERKKNTALSASLLAFLAKEGHAAAGSIIGDYPIQEVRSLDDKDCIYGLGDKTGFLNKRHYAYEMWNTDNPNPQEDNFKVLNIKKWITV